MGAVSPVPFATREFKQMVEDRIIRPTVNGMARDGIEFCGFLFIGLMNVQGEPYVIEYNVRMGDPESQSVFPRLKTDLVDLLWHATSKNLKNFTVETDPSVALTVVLASEGYPGNYEKGKVINIDPDRKDILLFHAGTRLDPQNQLLTNGGRVMAVTGMGTTLQEARTKVYEGIQNIHWDGKIYRKDIGIDLINP
jgi:phosphoribosylamine--glycine ligase